MAKTQEELRELKQKIEDLNKELLKLSDEEINEVVGGSEIYGWFEKIGKNIQRVSPQPSITITQTAPQAPEEILGGKIYVK